MTSHVSNVILSLTMSMFVDKECVYIISINAMKEVEKRGGNLVFLTKKRSLFSYKGLASISSLLTHFQGLFNLYLKPLATPHSYLCVLLDEQRIGSMQSIEIMQLVTQSPLKVTRWSRDSQLHSQPKPCHMDFTGKLGHEMVASRPQNLYLMLLLIFKERLQYSTPSNM